MLKRILLITLVTQLVAAQASAANFAQLPPGQTTAALSQPVTQSPPTSVTATAFQSPHATSAYTAGQLVANSATAGSVTPMAFAIAPANGVPVDLTSGILNVATTSSFNSAPAITSGTFLLHLYNVTTTVTNGDGGTYLASDINYCGTMTGTLGQQVPIGSDVASAVLTPLIGFDIVCTPAGGSKTIYALLEVTGNAWTPSVNTYNYQVTLSAR